MDLILCVLTNEDGTFEIYRRIQRPVWIDNSIIIVDPTWTPWTREDGNLLWR